MIVSLIISIPRNNSKVVTSYRKHTFKAIFFISHKHFTPNSGLDLNNFQVSYRTFWSVCRKIYLMGSTSTHFLSKWGLLF